MKDKIICNFENAGNRYAVSVFTAFVIFAVGLVVIGMGIDLHSPSYNWHDVYHSSDSPKIGLIYYIILGIVTIVYSLPALILYMKKLMDCKNYSYYLTATDFCERHANNIKRIPLADIKYAAKSKRKFKGYSYSVMKIGTGDEEFIFEYIGAIDRAVKIITETIDRSE